MRHKSTDPRSAPTPVAAGAGGPQVGQRVVSTDADRDQVIDIGGGGAAMDADAAVSRKDALAELLKAPATRAR